MTKNATPQSIDVLQYAAGQKYSSIAEVADALSGGDATLGWSASGWEQGDTLTIETNQNFFGQYGPIITTRHTNRNIAEGSEIVKEEGDGVFSSNNLGAPTVKDVPNLPYGKGISIGTEDSAANSTNYRQATLVTAGGRYRETYEASYIYWPKANQDNAKPFLNASATWQFKSIWFFDTPTGYASSEPRTDWFLGVPNWYAPLQYWTSGYKIVSNSKPISSFDRSATQLLPAPVDGVRSEYWVLNPVYRRCWVKPAPEYILGDQVGSDGFYRATDTVDGLLEHKTWKDSASFINEDVGASEVGIDRFTFPGFVRGHNKPLGCEAYMADVYVTRGDGPLGQGAPARIEITDSADYDASKLFAVMSITNWAAGKVVCNVHRGIHTDLADGTKHIHIFDYLDNGTYVGPIS